MTGVTNCGEGWTWSPDDGTLLGGVGLEEQSARYLLADPVTGRVTEEPWTARGVGSWQRISD
jgi:hypothetical protein